jgi:hypothetical protein
MNCVTIGFIGAGIYCFTNQSPGLGCFMLFLAWAFSGD